MHDAPAYIRSLQFEWLMWLATESRRRARRRENSTDYHVEKWETGGY